MTTEPSQCASVLVANRCPGGGGGGERGRGEALPSAALAAIGWRPARPLRRGRAAGEEGTRLTNERAEAGLRAGRRCGEGRRSGFAAQRPSAGMAAAAARSVWGGRRHVALRVRRRPQSTAGGAKDGTPGGK